MLNVETPLVLLEGVPFVYTANIISKSLGVMIRVLPIFFNMSKSPSPVTR